MTKSIAEHLVQFARTMVKDLGKEDGRKYLLRNVELWRREYGEAVAKEVFGAIRRLLKEAE